MICRSKRLVINPKPLKICMEPKKRSSLIRKRVNSIVITVQSAALIFVRAGNCTTAISMSCILGLILHGFLKRANIASRFDVRSTLVTSKMALADCVSFALRTRLFFCISANDYCSFSLQIIIWFTIRNFIFLKVTRLQNATYREINSVSQWFYRNSKIIKCRISN